MLTDLDVHILNNLTEKSSSPRINTSTNISKLIFCLIKHWIINPENSKYLSFRYQELTALSSV